MMAVEHVNITDPQIHEPVGASTATVDQVYASDGAGSGTWREIPYSDTVVMADVSVASFEIIPIPINLKIQSIEYVLHSAITGADSTITVTRGGDSASLGTQVIAFTSSAEGTTFTQTPSGNNTLTASTHKYLKFATNGNSSTTARMSITIKGKVV
jgi:hypothetical protein